MTVRVTNTGDRAGKETVLLYLSDEYREVTPERMLVRFARWVESRFTRSVAGMWGKRASSEG